jgi:hypothetical protein
MKCYPRRGTFLHESSSETFMELIARLDTAVDQAVNHDTLTDEINSP